VEKKYKFTYWKCPFCQLIIPDYKHTWNSIEPKVNNHLKKNHYKELDHIQFKEILRQLNESYGMKGYREAFYK